jgi:hypothetical protein
MANVRVILSLAPAPRLVHQARKALGSEAPSSFNHHRLRHLQALLYLFVPLALARKQYNTAAQNIAPGGRRRSDYAFQTHSLFARQYDLGGST